MNAPGSVSVQNTAHDACACKYSAVRKGYFEDPYIQHFVRGQSRKQPIINRGYFARVHAISQVVDSFLQATRTNPESEAPVVIRQILNLGAGFDTLYLNLKRSGQHEGLHHFDVDYPPVIRQKFKTLSTVSSLRSFICPGQPIEREDNIIRGEYGYKMDNYALIEADLNAPASVMEALQSAGFRTDLTTLVITECVLVYMERDCAQCLIQTLAACENALWVSYDMFNPQTDFGKVMVRNITTAGFSIPGMMDFPTIRDQEERFTLNGWQSSNSLTMKHVYDHWVTERQHARINRLEPFDEYEEWNLLMSHYSLTVAGRGSMCSLIPHTPTPDSPAPESEAR